jgi:hypothetical protein
MKIQAKVRNSGTHADVDEAFQGGRVPGKNMGRGSLNQAPFLVAISNTTLDYRLRPTTLGSER